MATPADTLVLRDIASLPGPPGLPVLGNLLQFRIADVHRALERWSAAYGPYFKLRLAKTTSLVVADAAALTAILRDRPDGFRRSDRVVQVAREMGLVVPGVFGAEGDEWRLQRKMVMSSFDPGHIKAYFPSMLVVTQRLRRRWLAAARAGAPIDLQADLMRYTVDTISGLAFGTDINTLESDDEVIQRHLDRIFPAMMKRMFTVVPYWRWFRLPSDRALDRSVAAIGTAIDTFIAQARVRLRDDPERRAHPRNLLEAMIAAADADADGAEDAGPAGSYAGHAAAPPHAPGAARRQALTDRHVAANVLTMLLAGEDTTANSLAWMIWLLSRNPAALARAQDEVRREVRQQTADDAEWSPERLNSLQYLDACVQETMRLKPVAPFMVVQALRATAIGDVRVPAGTYVWCVMRHQSVDESRVPGATTFDPARWLAAASAEAPSAGELKRLTMPFGAGPRMCPGRYLALLEIKLAMAMLLAHFDITGVTAPGGGDAVERMAFTMAPVGLTMRLKQRA